MPRRPSAAQACVEPSSNHPPDAGAPTNRSTSRPRRMTMPERLYRKLTAVSPRVVRELVPPNWAMELVGACPRHRSAIDRIDGERFALVTARVADAADLAPDEFEQRTFEAYDA